MSFWTTYKTHTYKTLKTDPTLKLMNKNNALVKLLAKDNFIDRKTELWLHNNNAVAPKIYGLPKIHKENIPLRPVVSNSGAASYNMSQFIGRIINNIVDKDIYNVRNSFDFKEFIENIMVPQDHVMVSFDIISLFTNIPTDLAINIINNKWKDIENHTRIPQQKFINLIKFVMIDCNYFSHNDTFIQQIFGTAMGNPASGIIANLVMDDLLDNVLPNLSFRPLFVKKYVDDLITIIPKDIVPEMLDKMNNYHPKIKFTVEIEENCSINYLDLKLIRNSNDNIITTDWYSKPYSTNRILNFESHHHLQKEYSI